MDRTKPSPTPTMSSKRTTTPSVPLPAYQASTNPPSYQHTSSLRPAKTTGPLERMEVDASDLEAGTRDRGQREPADVSWRIVVSVCLLAGIMTISYAVFMAIKKRNKARALTHAEAQREKEAFKQLASALQKLWKDGSNGGKTDGK